MRIIGTGLNRPDSTQLRAVQLGYVGLVPFAIAALLVWLFPHPGFDSLVLRLIGWILFYGALILSFLGGSHWGMAIRDWQPGRLLINTLPVLIAWLAVIPDGLIAGFGMDAALRYAIICFAFVMMLISEIGTKGEWAPWYRALRIRLNLVTIGFLLLVILGLIR